MGAPKASLVSLVAAAVLACGTAVAAPPSGPPSSLAEAKARLERARKDLSEAVARIEKERPSTADLDAAKRAIDALQAVLEQGSDYEPKDLDYARAALAARKEIRKRRPFIEKRRMEARLEVGRHDVEVAFDSLKDALKTLRDDSSASAFERARSAVTAVNEAIQRGQPLAKEYPAHKRYLAEAKARLTREEKKIHELEIDAAVADRKAQVEGADRALASALSNLKGKDVPDARFQKAEAAAVRLEKVLSEGKNLETEHAAYRSFASKTRAKLQKARKRIDTQWSEVGLSRLKAEVEPARSDLAQAAKPLKRKRPTEAQLAEARNAAIIVEKLLERYDGLSTKNTALGRYIREVKAALLDVQVNLQRRRVEEARAAVEAAVAPLQRRGASNERFTVAERAVKDAEEVVAAGKELEVDRDYRAYAREVRRQLRDVRTRLADRRTELAVERHESAIKAARKDLLRALGLVKRRAPTDDHFDEAKTAATVVEKTLDQADTKDAKLARYVLDQRRWLAAARRELRQRRLEVEIQRQRDAVEDARRGVTTALRKLRGKDVPDERFEAAEKSVKHATSVLKSGAALAKRDRDYASYAREVRKRLREAREKIEARRHEVAVYRQSKRVKNALNVLKRRLPRLPTTAEVEEAVAAAAAVEKALGAADPKVKKDWEYRKFAKNAREVVKKGKERIQRRRDEIATDEQIAVVEDAVAILKASVARLDSLSPGPKQFDAAAKALKEAQAALAKGKPLEKRLSRYAKWAARMERFLAGQGERIEKRKLEVAVGEGRARTDELLAAARVSVERAKQLDATSDDVARAVESTEALKKALAAGAALEKKDKRYAVYAAKAKAELVGFEKETENAKHVIAFRKGPIGEMSAGLAAAEKAAQTSDLRERQSRYQKALGRFEACRKNAADMIGDHPRIASSVVVAGGKQSTTKDVITMCVTHAKGVEQTLAGVNAVLAFYDGPAKSFEKGTALLDSGDEKEALKQFESCLANGRILQYKHPELKKRKFDVAGKKVTLPGLIADCDARAKKLRAGK